MKLTDLDPQFIKRIEGQEGWTTEVKDIKEAEGIFFLCPKCFEKNNGPVGTHSIICWTPKVPQSMRPGPGRWNLLGTGYGDLTLQAGSSSIQLPPPCSWHGWITNGEIKSC